MVRFKQTLCALLLTMVTGVAVAQNNYSFNNTNSPYTRYGFGDLADQNFGNSKAMGGIAFGLRDGAQINPLNPASYTAIDSLTFLFEGGVSLQNMNINSNGVKLNAKNSSFDYLAMQFRLQPWMAMSIGLLPYSSVGYQVNNTRSINSNLSELKTFIGDGGLHQLYVGLGAKVLKNLSLGANVSYFWGDIERSLSTVYSDAAAYYYQRDMIVSVSDIKFDFGAQFTHDFNKKHSITIGAIYSPKVKLNNSTNAAVSIGLTTSTSLSSYTAHRMDAVLELPNSFGFGFTYNYDKRLTLGMDYSLQQWSKTKNSTKVDNAELRNDFNDTYAYCDRTKISVGAEYIPSHIGRSYLSHIKYRFGGYYSTPYYKIDGKRAAREYGVTAGFGLPVPRSRSILSISGQFVRMKGMETNFVNENIFRLSIGMTINEGWFFKRKVE